jgi:hypothetical protein
LVPKEPPTQVIHVVKNHLYQCPRDPYLFHVTRFERHLNDDKRGTPTNHASWFLYVLLF